MSRPKRDDRLVYTGPYAPGVTHKYPPGTVVSLHTNRFHGPSVTVLLDRQDGDTEDRYADWAIEQTAPEKGEGP